MPFLYASSAVLFRLLKCEHSASVRIPASEAICAGLAIMGEARISFEGVRAMAIIKAFSYQAATKYQFRRKFEGST